jgi:hypothetical protein
MAGDRQPPHPQDRIQPAFILSRRQTPPSQRLCTILCPVTPTRTRRASRRRKRESTKNTQTRATEAKEKIVVSYPWHTHHHPKKERTRKQNAPSAAVVVASNRPRPRHAHKSKSRHETFFFFLCPGHISSMLYAVSSIFSIKLLLTFAFVTPPNPNAGMILHILASVLCR